MTRSWWFGGLMVCVMISVASARPGIVRTNDGRRIEGDVTEKDNVVVILIHGIETRIPAENVIRPIEYPPSFEEQYQTRLAKLDNRDIRGRITLARWAFDQRKYLLAKETLEEALKIDPNSAEVSTLLETVRGQIRLERTRTTTVPETPRITAPDKPPTVTPAVSPHQVLSPAQVNAVRQAELRADLDAQIAIRFDKSVVRRFINENNLVPDEFNALPTIQKVLQIVRDGDTRLKQDVKVLANPAAIAEFRQNVQRVVLSGCAAADCHNGPTGGDFILINPADSEAATVTNFYILSRYAKTVASPTKPDEGPVQRWMVARTNPGGSLLLQYGMPPQFADVPHPDVPGYKGVFRNSADQRYMTIFEWMGRTLQPSQPDYGVDFTPPGKKPSPAPTTAPTTAPATQPAP